MVRYSGNLPDVKTRQQLLGETWWTSEFLSMMRPGKDTSQLVKGRRLAERGQVIIKGMYSSGVEAVVLEAVGGSHRTAVWIADLEDDWEVVFRIFAANQEHYSKLLSGYYNKELDDSLKEIGIHIIPASLEDLDYRCDCESDHHTCSHIVATYMALGTQVNNDPLILFLLRGKTKEEIITGVSQYTCPETNIDEEMEKTGPGEEDEAPDLSRYYDPDPKFGKIQFRDVQPSDDVTDCFIRLGPSPFKFTRGDLSTIIAAVYPKAARYVFNLLDEKKK
jgi:uncharacterized Zn finger protein